MAALNLILCLLLLLPLELAHKYSARKDKIYFLNKVEIKKIELRYGQNSSYFIRTQIQDSWDVIIGSSYFCICQNNKDARLNFLTNHTSA